MAEVLLQKSYWAKPFISADLAFNLFGFVPGQSKSSFIAIQNSSVYIRDEYTITQVIHQFFIDFKVSWRHRHLQFVRCVMSVCTQMIPQSLPPSTVLKRSRQLQDCSLKYPPAFDARDFAVNVTLILEVAPAENTTGRAQVFLERA